MSFIEFLGEGCTFDSAYIRGWRWLFSARYRGEIRARCAEHHWALVTLGVLEAMVLMLAEIVALVLVARWLFTS
jgi:hypothetical protein